MAHVVVLGAGLGGVIMAYEVREKLKSKDKVTVVTKGAHFSFVPSNPWVAVGWRQKGDIEVDLAAALGSHKIALENARTICEFVAGQKKRRGIILASVSKGSADVKMAIQQCGREPYFRRVIGWYNIGGINRGTILINEIENDWYYRTEARTYFCLNGYNWEGFRSMRFAEEAPLNFNLELPEHVLLINIIGVPTDLSVTERARPYWEHLAQIGPNDGLSLLTDVYMPGG